MRETLQLHASIIGRDQHIQSMVRTITCNIPLDGYEAAAAKAAAASTADQMRMAASSGGLLLNKGQKAAQHSALSVQRPLVALSESEADWTCSSALTTNAGPASISAHFMTSKNVLVLLVLWTTAVGLIGDIGR